MWGNEPTANVINSSGNDTDITKSDINIPGILHLINEAPENNKVIDKDIFQAFISKHPHGPEAYWSNPKDFCNHLIRLYFFMHIQKVRLIRYLYIHFLSLTHFLKLYILYIRRCNC